MKIRVIHAGFWPLNNRHLSPCRPSEIFQLNRFAPLPRPASLPHQQKLAMMPESPLTVGKRTIFTSGFVALAALVLATAYTIALRAPALATYARLGASRARKLPALFLFASIGPACVDWRFGYEP